MRRAIALLVLGACARSNAVPAPTPSPVEAGMVDAGIDSTARACDKPVEVTASVEGSWIGSATSESTSPPALVVGLADPTLGSPSSREITRIPIPQPFFAANVKLGELCSDEGTRPDRLEARCVAGGRIVSVVVATTRSGLTFSIDGAPPTPWNDDHGCYTFRTKLVHRDLEPTRAAWGRDEPDTKCASAARTIPVKVAVDFRDSAGQPRCLGSSGPTNAASVTLSIPSTHWQARAWTLSNMCGGLHVTRYDDAEALLVETSDMGNEERFFYRLADRLYYVDDRGTGVASTALPCGARVTFDVHDRWHDSLVEDRGSLRVP